MGKRFGDSDFDDDVDIRDLLASILHYDPLANASNGWSHGNFDGDNDVDSFDFHQSVLNFSPLGYTSDSAKLAALISIPSMTPTTPTGTTPLTVDSNLVGTGTDSLATQSDIALNSQPTSVVRHLSSARHPSNENIFIDEYFSSRRTRRQPSDDFS